MIRLLLFTAALVLLADGKPTSKLRPREGELKVGDAAPAFCLKQLGADKPVKLAELKGKPVVLVFGSCT